MSRRLTPSMAHRLAADIVAASRARYGTATMTAPTGEQAPPAGGQPPPAGGEQQQPAASSTGGGQPGGQTTAEPRFTQADLDRIIGERLASEKSKFEQQLQAAQELAGKNETEKLTIERDQAKAAAVETQRKAAERVARTEAKVAAIAAGANPDRVDAIVRNADLAAAVKDGEVDETAVKAAVEKVLSEYPEWKGPKAAQVPSSSGGELNGGGGGGKPTFTRKQLAEMPPEEVARRIDEINDAIADGRVTG